MDKQRILANLLIAIEAVLANRVRSILTALGIIFGVAAVIAMLAIGNGAQQEILEQIKLVGVNNIIIEPVVEQTEEDLTEEDQAKEKKKFSPGLTLADKQSIMETIPGIETISPEILLETYIIKNGIRRSAKLVGVEPAYFEIFNFTLSDGKMFNETQLEKGEAVCIIGKSIAAKFFPSENPIGKMIKCGPNWLKVIGILDERYISESSISKLGIRDYNMDVYTPLQTVLVRYKNRAMLTQEMIQGANKGSSGMVFFGGNGGNDDDSSPSGPVNYHQLDRLVVQVAETEKLNPTADVIVRMLERKHNQVVDYEIEIPELLLKQQQRTNDIFSYVLGAIAGISLIVGGIGIMNIMLASVLERIKEIGLRLSIGAKKNDIINQFMFESMMISISGGFIGIVLGVIMAFAVSRFAEIPTVISFGSILISFGVATAIGLIFGIAPARKAALQDPITSLRYE
ncbi:MAG: ABC transporter permease [Ekhidna sp.]|uniref:ABC transporter permease n=1 Tax=Ekhidna sp. TaxID=2608089 RepID=UPI0032F01465